MKTPRASISPQEATEAVYSVLDTLSFIRRQDIRIDRAPRDPRIGLLVQVDVFGRPHTLACALHARAFPEGLDAALFDVHSAAAALGGSALPVLIAPGLSPEAQAHCRQNHIAYLDLEGNAYLDVGEIFVARRSVFPHPHSIRSECRKSVQSAISPRLSIPQTGSFPC
jgi:hypothetical protein